MRRELLQPDDSIRSIGRELRLTGDLVYAGSFGTDADDESSALFFARLFTSMTDDGLGVFVDPRSFDGSRMILDGRILDGSGETVGYILEEIIEPGESSTTLFCAVMLHANGLQDVRRILQTSMLWPMLSISEARCSACGRMYNYRLQFDWCPHLIGGKQPIVMANIRRLVLTEDIIRQDLSAMFDAPDGFADIALDPLDGMDEVIRLEGGRDDEMAITFAINRDIGYDSIIVGGMGLVAGQRVAIPLSMVRDAVDWNLISSGIIVPIDHIGTTRSLFPTSAVPEAGGRTDTREGAS